MITITTYEKDNKVSIDIVGTANNVSRHDKAYLSSLAQKLVEKEDNLVSGLIHALESHLNSKF